MLQADVIGEAVETEAIGEQQLKRIDAIRVNNLGAATEADAIGEQQLKWTQSGPGSSCIPANRRIRKYVAERAKLRTCTVLL